MKCPLRLSANLRPVEIGNWLKWRSYSTDRIPFISNVDAYRKNWLLWWTDCQPPWRKTTGWPLSRDQGTNSGWGKLAARGQNGLFIVIMSVAWWGFSLKSADDQRLFDEVVVDIQWVVEQMLKLLPASTPDIPHNVPPPPAAQKDLPPATNWFVRAEGKRQPKLSHKVLGK